MTVPYTEILVVGGLLLLPILYESSHVFRYHLKFFVYYFIVMFNSVLLIPVFCLRAKNVKNLILASYFCRWITALIGIRWILRGSDNLHEERACIIVSNHQSSLDILGMFNIWPTMGKCTVVAKRELFFAWPFGLAAWLAGLIFIPRVQKDEAKVIMNKAAEKIKSDKTKLFIFPEGTRRNTGQIHPFKKGAFHLAISAQLPILPVTFSRYYFLDKETKRFDSGVVIVNALDAIDTKGMTFGNLDDLMENVRDKMSASFRDSTKEVLDMVHHNNLCSQKNL
ncbi:1-acyl-sn-glycerol-3-phosphate acyltransferase alpha [Cylas formicarius]|uniref:1-acyl-sn-glycerol-3-phosphate acyltransferase alpha n=1 Tax=Cylas formicarius TaxID=197179 RepID=UPI0029583239|nr:1-acyl-sn-glycerol-3-phosphate acyltransferase alpha [Cylas formicarius]